MKTLIVGGNINPRKESKIINTLVDYHNKRELTVANGFLLCTETLEEMLSTVCSLTLEVLNG
jgi:hypothetical protein